MTPNNVGTIRSASSCAERAALIPFVELSSCSNFSWICWETFKSYYWM